jgi:hypothetical protein
MREARLLVVSLGLCAFGCCEPFKWSCPPGPVAKDTECLTTGAGPSTASCKGADPEPNDTMPMSRDMPAADCSEATVKGSLGGKNDTDYFHVHSTLCENGTPSLELDTEGIQACLFVQCSTASTSVLFCSDHTPVAHHPSGLLGCCSSGTSPVSFAVSCDGKNKNVDVFLVTGNATSDACTPYSVRYHL